MEGYVTDCLADGLAAGSINRHLNVLGLIVRSARRRRLPRDDPVELIDRPREARRRWRILTPAEVAAVQRAFGRLEREAEPDERPWIGQPSAALSSSTAPGCAAGELLGLRWRHVCLADPE